MCKGMVCLNLLITPVYFEIVFATDSVFDVQCPCHMFVEYDSNKFEITNHFDFFVY